MFKSDLEIAQETKLAPIIDIAHDLGIEDGIEQYGHYKAKIDYKYKGKSRIIYAKAEYHNLTGSIKDRMAFHILSESYKSGELRPDMHIMEATSGNTGISFSALGKALGHEVTIFMPNWLSVERMNLIRSFGANIRLVTQEEGGFVARRRLPVAEVGDYVALEVAGAYGSAMGSNYNSKPLAAEVLINGGRVQLIRKRQSFEHLIANEIPLEG